jgi:hypothetical protein
MTYATAPHRWAILTSVLVGIIGLQWWLAPATYPFGPGDESGNLSLLTRLEADWAAALAGLLAAAGLVTARALDRPLGPVGRRVALAAAGVQVIVLGYVVPDITALMVVAYVLALVGPIAVVGVAVVRGARRWPIAAPAVLTVAVAGAVGGGIVTPAAVAGMLRGVGAGFEQIGTRSLYVLGALAAGALWAAVVARTVRDVREPCGDCGRVRWGRWATPERAASWGRTVTWAAALCPMPYALLRLTWLTPWPVGISHEELAAEPGLRLFGLLLGIAAFGGMMLTLGLTRRWGEVVPRWVPGWCGRSVPVAVAVVPALVVSATVTVGGHSIIQAVIAEADDWREPIGHLLVFPFPIWGLLLAAAALGYALRRRTDCVACERSASTLAGVPTTDGAVCAEGLGAPDPRGGAARRTRVGSRPRARLRARGRSVAGM